MRKSGFPAHNPSNKVQNGSPLAIFWVLAHDPQHNMVMKVRITAVVYDSTMYMASGIIFKENLKSSFFFGAVLKISASVT